MSNIIVNGNSVPPGLAAIMAEMAELLAKILIHPCVGE
jgi:hypothetical protein